MAKAKKDRLTIDEAILPIDEQPYELPENWCWVKHNSILDISGGSQPAKSHFISEPAEGYTQLYQTRDYGEHPIPVYIPDKYATKTTVEGDILLARYGGSLGKVFRAHDGAYNVALAKVIKLYPNLIDDEFLYKYYLSQFYQDFCIKASNGRSAQAGFNREDMDEIPFPLPPLAEQKRIVEQIEKLFSKLDEASEKLQNTLEDLQHTYEAIIQSASDGELSRKWRENNKKSIDDWEHGVIRDYITTLTQGWSPKCNNNSSENEESWGVIKTTSIQRFIFDGSENKELPNSLEPRTKHEIKAGDILVTRAGPRVRVGICCLVENVRNKLLLCDKAYRFRTNEKMLAEYFVLQMNSTNMMDVINQMKTGISESGLNLTQDGFIAIPMKCPPIEEQKYIVDICGTLLKKNIESQNICEETIFKIESVKKSILARAFRGELGTNIADEESSIELLKSIIEAKEN